MGWIMALALIIGALIFAPTIGMRLGRKTIFIIIAPYLTIISAIVFWCIQSHYLGWWRIYHA
jgi:Na+/melibiose symporter-like transporter